MAQQKRMFKNPILEVLSLSGPKMMITYHLIVASAILVYGLVNFFPRNIFVVLGLFFGGYFLWTFAEYLLHRFLFHWVNDWKFVKRFHYAMHGYHHSVPNDHKRLFMPPVPASLFLLAFFGLFYAIIGSYAWFILPGFELGYLTYALCHYLVHTNPKSKLVARLSHHHILHHYKYPDKAFGVSTRIWDRIFGTMPPNLERKA